MRSPLSHGRPAPACGAHGGAPGPGAAPVPYRAVAVRAQSPAGQLALEHLDPTGGNAKRYRGIGSQRGKSALPGRVRASLGRPPVTGRGVIRGMVPISARPAEDEDRKAPLRRLTDVRWVEPIVPPPRHRHDGDGRGGRCRRAAQPPGRQGFRRPPECGGDPARHCAEQCRAQGGSGLRKSSGVDTNGTGRDTA